MITFERGTSKFNFRVAGVAIHNNKILIHMYEGFDFWALPGGRAELQETTIETIKREMKEELNKKKVNALDNHIEHIITYGD